MDKKNIHSLLSDHNLVVPEIQREYVWGSTKNKKVLEQFLLDLDVKLSQGDANIGFLYSYKSGAEHYLIDGQQRFTTILLLLFYLSVAEGEDTHAEFVNLLRLSNNLQAFSYRVRSYTESFLQNLLSHDTINAKEVEDQVWFKSEYKGDPTIDSMIGALSTFEEIITSVTNISYKNIMEKVFFWYFDVEQTFQGEELYITMNSRGEKLTDSEQIKPRLLRNESTQKEYYGKKWDEWEEFFYSKSLRGNRKIDVIDTAMSNVIRIVIELKDIHEHDHIKPVEDSSLITLDDIEKHMVAIQGLSKIQNGRYAEEVAKLYGDNKSDGNFYVLKALITTYLRNPKDTREYERVYQTITNHVRRNKIRHRDFLVFLDAYKQSTEDCNFYFVAKTACDGWKFVVGSKLKTNNSVFTGHELEKIEICIKSGEDAENAIWKEQAKPFWNGDIKQLLIWAKQDGEFCLDEFIRISNNFNLLFDQNENAGWTTDNVRQALITRKMPYYPYDNRWFGYSSSEWKKIIQANQGEFLHFINLFDGMDAQLRDEKIDSLKQQYVEKEENTWAEFVHHDYLLDYCNKKHIQYRKEYGFECVKNEYAQPHSVKNQHLENYLYNHIPEIEHWNYWVDRSGWKSVVKLYRDNYPFALYIQYRADADYRYEIRFVNQSDDVSKEALSANAISAGFEFIDDSLRIYTSCDLDELFNKLKELTTIPLP